MSFRAEAPECEVLHLESGFPRALQRIGTLEGHSLPGCMHESRTFVAGFDATADGAPLTGREHIPTS